MKNYCIYRETILSWRTSRSLQTKSAKIYNKKENLTFRVSEISCISSWAFLPRTNWSISNLVRVLWGCWRLSHLGFELTLHIFKNSHFYTGKAVKCVVQKGSWPFVWLLKGFHAVWAHQFRSLYLKICNCKSYRCSGIPWVTFLASFAPLSRGTRWA